MAKTDQALALPILKTVPEPEVCDVAAFVDLETSGLDPRQNEVLELGIVLFAFDRASGEIRGIIDRYEGLREPDGSVSRESTAIHGLTKRKLRGERLDDARIRSLFERASFIVSHNAAFDQEFMSQLYPWATDKPWLCSMRGIKWRSMGFQSMGLQNLLRDYGIHVEEAHRAAPDIDAALMLLSLCDGNAEAYLKKLLRSQPVIKRPKAASTGSTGESAKTAAATGCLGCGGCSMAMVAAVVVVIIALLAAL